MVVCVGTVAIAGMGDANSCSLIEPSPAPLKPCSAALEPLVPLVPRYMLEQEEKSPRNPKITAVAASLKREGPVGDRLHASAKRDQPPPDDAAHSHPKSPRAGAGLRSSQTQTPGAPYEDLLLEKWKENRAKFEAKVQEMEEQERARHHPQINAVSKELAESLPSSSKDRLQVFCRGPHPQTAVFVRGFLGAPQREGGAIPCRCTVLYCTVLYSTVTRLALRRDTVPQLKTIILYFGAIPQRYATARGILESPYAAGGQGGGGGGSPSIPKSPSWENWNLQQGKSCQAIFGPQTFGSQTPPPLSNISLAIALGRNAICVCFPLPGPGMRCHIPPKCWVSTQLHALPSAQGAGSSTQPQGAHPHRYSIVVSRCGGRGTGISCRPHAPGQAQCGCSP